MISISYSHQKFLHHFIWRESGKLSKITNLAFISPTANLILPYRFFMTPQKTQKYPAMFYQNLT